MTRLLDTNVCVRLLNGTSPPLTARASSHHPSDLLISSVTVAELVYGAHRSARKAENLRLLSRFLSPFALLPFDDECAERSGMVRAYLAERGTPIGPHDLLIGATALEHDLILVTHNTREFRRVPGLSLEDWEEP